ncbi:hypothetical protein [Nocardia sp. R6R-6]|uniref:hypothetical protein n=1 Tax=Nocardia sp. R6R-6 TaxID=3459303 RepID=UPI00403DC32E
MTEHITRQVNTVDELVAIAELVDIIFFEVSGKRTSADPLEESAAATDIEIAVRSRIDGVDVRCLCRVTGGGGEYVCDAAAQYEFGQPATVAEEVLTAFVQRVGIMTVYPYLRESITASATKLRLDPPLLRLLRPGDVHATPKS